MDNPIPFETPETQEIINNNAESLWAKVYAESYKQFGNSKATKDADKAVKEFKKRFK